MPEPFPHQVEGAQWLAAGGTLLAWDPRVGKTGTAVIACDYLLARRILVVTTATGRANFGREFREWQALPRVVQVLLQVDEAIRPEAGVLVVGWSVVADRKLLGRLLAWRPDVLVLDESHYAKSPGAKRAHAAAALTKTAERTFLLTGTPMPNAPNDLWLLLSALAPERIDRLDYDAFVRRYCFTRPKWVAGQRIEVVMGGRNLPELRERLGGWWHRLTQKDVGIREPIYSLLTLEGPVRQDDEPEDVQAVLDAVEFGDTRALEMHLGPVRRITGQIKAAPLAEVVLEEFRNGLDRIVLMCWHTDVIAQLAARLSVHGVRTLDGGTLAVQRQKAVDDFQRGDARVFIGQIQAAGESIDLSASCNLIFVEASWTPKDMRQAALRITNHEQKRQCLVRFAALAGSIDEAVMGVLTRKVATIREVLRA